MLNVRSADGARLTLYHRPATPRRYLEPVVLSHGLCANRYGMDFEPPHSLALALAAEGFECFVLELRGSGRSRPPPGRRRYSGTFDDFVQQDAPAFLDSALKEAKAPRAFWVGHSMGGLVGYGLAEGSDAERLAGLVTLGSPVFYPRSKLLDFISRTGAVAAWPWALRYRLLSLGLAPWFGRAPLPAGDVFLYPENIPPEMIRRVSANALEGAGYGLMSQFREWILHDAFRSLDGTRDYRKNIAELTIPVLVLGGAQDRLASEESVRRQFELLTTKDKTLAVFGRANGDTCDYGHGDLVFGQNAPTEVYPVIARWLKEKGTLFTSPGSTPQGS
jgi:pimeloyl-ACP methyl ester carboxylesterase